MAAGSFFRLLLVTSLVFSHLICMNAVPVTRTESLMHGYQVHQLPENNHLVIAEKEKNIIGRMIVELNDYPGSGANNRHTPRAQLGRSGCVDC